MTAVVALLPPSLAAPPLALALSSQGFNYTGSEQTFTVPAGVTSVTVTAKGAAGGRASNGTGGGGGGTTTATITVTPGETLYVYVGGTGGDNIWPPFPCTGGGGGFNGGADHGYCAGGGGGASDVRQGGNTLADRVVVAGGGGGGGNGYTGSSGGDTTGGTNGVDSVNGGGGTPSEGGGAGASFDSCPGTAGALGAGGTGSSCSAGGGGGGGGYYGGGGGGDGSTDTLYPGGGGGGGSSYAEPSATNVSYTQGGNYAAGVVSLSYLTPTTTTVTSSRNPSNYGDSVTLTATIGGGDVPTGTVDFEDFGSSISGCSAQTVSHTNQKATCTTSALGTGTREITAVYSGDSNYGTSTSDVFDQVVHAVKPGAPTIVSAVSGEDSQVPVTWTAPAFTGGAISYFTVTAEPGGATCRGDVEPLRHRGAFPNLSCTVTGLTDGTQYSFTVTETNSAGTGPASAAVTATPGAVPVAPETPVAVAGDGQATVSWALPLLRHAFSPIRHYTVTSSPGGKTCTYAVDLGAVHAPATVPSYSCTVTGLTNGTAYTFTVTATNSVGTGPASDPSNSVVPAGVPLVVQAPTASAGDTEATVSWDAFDGNGADVSSYTVTSSPGDKTCAVDINSDLRHASPQKSYSCTVTGLTNGTEYTFAVTATNRVGTSDASVSNAVTPAGLPGAPRNVTATAGVGQAAVAWKAPASDGGSAITKYTVVSDPGGARCTTSGALSCTVSGLDRGTAYTFSVRATNAAGAGPTAESSSVTTPDLPGKPLTVKAKAGQAKATVRWSAPSDDGGSAITGYTVTSKPGRKSCSTAGSLSCTVASLTPATAYTFTVTATNGVGTGPASDASNAVTPTCIPPSKVGSVTGKLACGAKVSTGGGSGAASVTVPPGATSGGVDVKLNDVTEAPPAGVTTYSAGSTVLDLTVTDLKTGKKITKFAKPLVLHFPAPVSGVPATSQDGKTWTPLTKLKHPSLPADQQDGYYVEKDGSVDIYTRHATFFGVMHPAAPVLQVQISRVAWLKLTWTPGSGGGPVASYLVLGPNGQLLATSETSAVVFSHLLKKDYPATLQVVALDAAGDRSAASQTITVTPIARPKTLPHRIPRWAEHLLAWQRHLRHGPRPHTPAKLPHWWHTWKHWRLHMLELTVSG